MNLSNLIKAFEEEIVPDMGLAMLLSDERAKEDFYKAKANVCESEAETLTEWLVDLSADLEHITLFANDRVADFLEKYVNPNALAAAGMYVNPDQEIAYDNGQPCIDILVSERGHDCSLDLRQKKVMPEEVCIYANPKHEVELAGSFLAFAFGESRVHGLGVDQVEARDYSLLGVTGSNVVVQGDWAVAYENTDYARFTPRTNYLASYTTFTEHDPCYAECCQMFNNRQEEQLLQWGRQVQEEKGYRFDWSTVREQHRMVFSVTNDELMIEWNRPTNAVTVYARLSERSLMNEIRWHGMPANASECMRQLPRKDLLREFIQCYRSNGLQSLRIGDGYLRYNMKNDQMEVVVPNWGDVLASVPYDKRLSMSENIRMMREIFGQQEVSRGTRQSR